MELSSAFVYNYEMNTGGRARLCEEFSRQLGTNAHTSEKNSSFFNDRLVVFSMVIFVFVVCRSVGSHRHHCHSHFVVKKQRAKKVLNVLPVKVVRVISKRLICGSFGLRAILQCPWGGGGAHPEILGGGMPPGSPNPDPISDQKMLFSTPVSRPDL